MKAARYLLGLATVGTVAAAIGAGCGGSSTSGGSGDSGTDATADVAVEAAAEAAAEAAVEAGPDVLDAASDSCTPDASIGSLPIPDASLSDSGATAESCITCVETNCPTVVALCNMDCACVSAFAAFEQCLGTGQGLQTCAVAFGSAGVPGITLQQLACGLACASPSICGVTIPSGDGGNEGGGKDSGGKDGSPKDGSKGD